MNTINTIHTLSVSGTSAHHVRVTAELLRRLPAFVIAGLSSGESRETAERVRSSLAQHGVDVPRRRVNVTVDARGEPLWGTSVPALDLPIAVAIMGAASPFSMRQLSNTAFVGELSLGGEVRATRGVLPMVRAAAEAGFTRIVVPAESMDEATFAPMPIEVVPVWDMGDVIALVREATVRTWTPRPEPQTWTPDMADLVGHARGKRAMEVAAAGGHHVILVGQPGCGMARLASRLPGILRPMLHEQMLDTACARSAAGLPVAGERPFRAPHHTLRPSGMIGVRGLPGELALAHNGVLMLDEVHLFNGRALDAVLSAAETGRVGYRALVGEVDMPARIQLVMATSPDDLPYMSAKQPIIEAADVRVRLRRQEQMELPAGPVETSAMIRERVSRARDMQRARGFGYNAHLSGPELHAAVGDMSGEVPADASDRARVLRVARTIADLAGSEDVRVEHCSEAMSLCGAE